jgi:L,D-peptidoglycan transpeptidase YkuD (ErfK/YbiS/YcfS/YnhG family)
MQDLIVRADAPATDKGWATTGWAELKGKRFRCALGRGGIRADKREGDGATPIGRFPLRRVFFRDTPPKTALPLAAISQRDGWCDAPDDIAYNRAVVLPYPASHEVMWRTDHLYDRVLVIGHNDDPVVPGLGSAVFVHLAHGDYRPTEGCIAFARDDLETILVQLSPEDYVTVLAP